MEFNHLKDQVIYVDVDDTIINHWDEPKQHVIDFLEYAKNQGAILYLWSAGGEEYCRRIAFQLGIHGWFKNFLDKPNKFIDDLTITTQFPTQHIHPIQLVGLNWKSKP